MAPVTQSKNDHGVEDNATNGKDTFDLVLDTPGKSITHLVNTLLPALKSDIKTVAQKVFSAPSVLISDVAHDKALKIKELLEETGAHLSIHPKATYTSKQETSFETALIVKDVNKIPTVLQKVAMLLRISVAEAQRLLFKSPILVLGNLSETSARALRDCFAEFDAEILLSDTTKAQYDLYLNKEAAHLRNELLNTLHRQGINRAENSDSPNQPLIATGLNKKQAITLWEQYSMAGDNFKIINRDFYTFDLRWQTADKEASIEPIATYLNKAFGLPVNAFEKIRSHKGLILAQDLNLEETEKHLTALTQIGAHCLANLTTLQSYTCILKDTGKREETLQAIEVISGLQKPAIERALKTPSRILMATNSKLQANWLRHAIRQNGGTLEIKTDA